MTDTKEQHYFIPATPGYWTLDLIGSDEPGSSFAVWRYPIVAWEMRFKDNDKPGLGHFAVPVTPEWDTVSYHPETAPILAPDGRVSIAGESVHDSEEAWFEAAKKEHRRNRLRAEERRLTVVESGGGTDKGAA